jgi:putative phosphoesterase
LMGVESQTLARAQASGAKIVGLISDTHVPVRAEKIPLRVFKVFEEVDFIIHAGDLVKLWVVDELEQLAPVLVVYGNMDGPEVRGKLPRLNSLKVFDWRIGVTHDPKALFGIGKMRELAAKNGFDVLVYGHTHSASVKWDGDVLFVNPGSPTNPAPPFLAKPSVGLLRVTKEKITPEIIQI